MMVNTIDAVSGLGFYRADLVFVGSLAATMRGYLKSDLERGLFSAEEVAIMSKALQEMDRLKDQIRDRIMNRLSAIETHIELCGYQNQLNMSMIAQLDKDIVKAQSRKVFQEG